MSVKLRLVSSQPFVERASDPLLSLLRFSMELQMMALLSSAAVLRGWAEGLERSLRA